MERVTSAIAGSDHVSAKGNTTRRKYQRVIDYQPVGSQKQDSVAVQTSLHVVMSGQLGF